MIYNHAMEEHTSRAEQFAEINNPGDLDSLLLDAGFNVLDNQPDHVKLDGAIEATLSRVATGLGYDAPEFGMRTQDVRFKCYIRYASSGAGIGRTFTAFGRPAHDSITARRLAVYNSLLAFSVNYGVVISDVNHDAYLFCKERFDVIASNLAVLRDIGNSICSFVDSIITSLNAMIGVYSHVPNRHCVGQVLVEKLESLRSDLVDCINTNGPMVVQLKQEAFVGMIPY